MEEAKASLKMLRKCGAEVKLQILADMMENEGSGFLALPLPVLCFFSETPKFLIKKGRMEEAKAFRNVAQIFQQVLGLDSILFFGPLLQQSAGYTYNASFVAPLIAGVVRDGVIGLTYPSYNSFDRQRTLVSVVGFWLCHFLYCVYFFSETPRFLIKKGHIEEAKASLKMLRKCVAEAKLQMLAGMRKNEGKRKRKKLSYSPLLLVNIEAQIFQQLLGLNSILFIGPLLLQSAGYTYNASFVASLIAGVVRAGVIGLTYLSYNSFDRWRTLV
uniref:Sugar transport protein 4-like n=1 Tax=Nicotiana sylvestris TaxID=4096 RepID=A0A1U7XVS4_NICSY|nr:PREDICTED: sugar transport protein 4-like [Nicotiana sylvestris]